MKIVTDFSVGSRPPQVSAGFAPGSLFRAGEVGVHYAVADQDEVFSDTSGLVPAEIGQSVARVNDRSGNDLHAVQSSIALRPALGRAPANMRNRVPNNRMDGTQLGTVGSGGSLPAGWDFTGGLHPEVVASGVLDDLPYVDVRFAGTPSTNMRVRFASNTTIPAANGQTWTESMGLALVGGSLANTTDVRVEIEWRGVAGASISGQTFGAGDVSASLTGTYQRFSGTFTATVADTSFISPRVRIGWSSGPVDFTLRIFAPQIERSAEASALQITGANGFDVSEGNLPAPAFLRFDLSDDVLPTAFPDGGTFDVMVFGRRGSWIERGVTIAAAGSLNIGPTTITGAEAGVLPALGDIVGWTAVDRTLTDAEVSRLVQYHKARGARGLLVPGPELISNGGAGFADTSGWQPISSSMTIGVSDGRLFVQRSNAASAGAARAVYPFPVTVGAAYLIEMTGSTEMDTLRGALRADGGIDADRAVLNTSSATPVTGRRVGTGRPGDAGFAFGTVGSVSFADGRAYLHALSIRELRPEEDW